MIMRRQFLQWAGVGLAAGLVPGYSRAWAAGAPEPAEAGPDWAMLERASGGRLGVCLIDSGSGRRWGHRQEERFPMCSTFKFLLVAAVLQQVDQGRMALTQRVPIRQEDMIAHAPVTEKYVGRGLNVGELCRATMIWSDNPAANLLLPLVGDPAGLTAFLRATGDSVTRSDRNEPTMNLFSPDDPRDTTTPAAMAVNLQRLVLGTVLSPASRRILARWLIDNRTGDRRLRAGLPSGWTVGDKTGSNGTDTTNDIAVIWPGHGRAPFLLASYLQGASVDAAARDDTLRQVAVLAAGPMAR